MNKCTACPDQFHSNNGRTYCDKCAPGQIWNGTFVDYTKSNDNTIISIGTEAGICTPCPAGKYNVEGKGATCTNCLQIGTYSYEGSSACTLVPSGTHAKPNRTGHQLCARGKYSHGAVDECLECDNGLQSEGESEDRRPESTSWSSLTLHFAPRVLRSRIKQVHFLLRAWNSSQCNWHGLRRLSRG